MPKATEPARFSAVIHHEIREGRQANGPSHSSAQANQLATRKQMEPSASGRQIGVVFGGRAQPDEQRAQGGPVEPHRPDQLDARRPPVDAAVPDPQQRAEPVAVLSDEVGRGARDLHVLQEGGRREEDGPDEERDVVRGGAHRGGVGRERAEREADGPDGEQDPHPPVHGERRPPGGAAGDPAGVLAVPARIPQEARAVREPEDLPGHEGTEAAAVLAPPSLGNLHVADGHGGSP